MNQDQWEKKARDYYNRAQESVAEGEAAEHGHPPAMVLFFLVSEMHLIHGWTVQ